jgi:hypothetical protein
MWVINGPFRLGHNLTGATCSTLAPLCWNCLASRLRMMSMGVLSPVRSQARALDRVIAPSVRVPCVPEPSHRKAQN